MDTAPLLFLSHGSPMLALIESPAHRFLQQLGASLPRPRAIVVVSAHWQSISGPSVSLASAPPTIYDFGGFPPALSEIVYPAPGAPGLASDVAAQIEQAGFAVRRHETRGLDHGAWVPLAIMYPDADIPVFQVSLIHGAGPREHERLGRALASLRTQGVMIVGSGSLTHNLYEFFGQPIESPAPEWVTQFADWMHERIARNDREAVLAYREQAPFAARNHPTEEHLLPLFVAMGAAGDGSRAQRIHQSYEYGVLAMDAYAFS
ncbi:dioxygenase [Pararobbsia silviterrae]|uniref:Dioxygenase n=1 Tax=Pararobbsia silviterrae TaxID=1792498 RepID=A0A494XZ45_9BURK|nr:class III extradiol ring-cleavage dioxygenase [Pararobbsia silviterrae]RKP55787.1 dioxygenase [Pararobbsia silviterrae]